jgi:hypothetical protein
MAAAQLDSGVVARPAMAVEGPVAAAGWFRNTSRAGQGRQMRRRSDAAGGEPGAPPRRPRPVRDRIAGQLQRCPCNQEIR